MAQADLTGADREPQRSSGSSILYDPTVRSLFFQAAALILLVYLVYSLVVNTIANLEARGQSFGFDFLDQVAGFSILPTFGTYIVGYEVGISTYWDIFVAGLINTAAIAMIGIVLATVLGFVMGVMRLSSNVVLKSFATIFVEIFRNIPLLLWIFIIYFVVLRLLPNARGQIEIWPGAVGLNIKGLYAPFPIFGDGFWMTTIAIGVGILAWLGISAWAKQRQDATGQQFPSFWVGLGAFLAIPLVVFYSTGAPLVWEFPVFKETGPVFRRGFEQGTGMVVISEYLGLLLALVLYTAAFIAEIVRAGILAVNKGQTEAANALGIRPQPTLNLIIIPQALRVIIPPLTSQYLNLTKNSSLAVAIAYPDLVSVFMGTTLNQVGRAVEIVGMGMAVYLCFSILTSLLMNWYNARIKLVER